MRRASTCSTGVDIPRAFATLTPKYANFARTFGSASLCNSRRTAAFVHFSVAFERPAELERFGGVEKDRDRTFIYQLHGHGGLKNARRHSDSQSPECRAKLFVPRLGGFWRRRGHETRAALSTRVAINSKLRNDQCTAADVQQRKVHFAMR